MRADPVLSVRQKRLLTSHPEVVTTRQHSEVKLSERMVRGFKRNATRIAKRQGIPYDKAAAILAASSRRASAAAKRRNPRLKKVKGKAEK
jgi:hypothetical protein